MNVVDFVDISRLVACSEAGAAEGMRGEWGGVHGRGGARGTECKILTKEDELVLGQRRSRLCCS